MFIIADLNSEEQAELLDRVRGFVARSEGQICREYLWGMRKLAYPIRRVWHLSSLVPQWRWGNAGRVGAPVWLFRAGSEPDHQVEDWESAAAKFESLVDLKSAEEASDKGEDKEDDDLMLLRPKTNPLKPTKTKTPIRNEMAKKKKRPMRSVPNSILLRRKRKVCPFKEVGIEEIDYKDLELLKSYVTEGGRLFRAAFLAYQRHINASWRSRSSELAIWLCYLHRGLRPPELTHPVVEVIQ